MTRVKKNCIKPRKNRYFSFYYQFYVVDSLPSTYLKILNFYKIVPYPFLDLMVHVII